uniref:Uncharacterized protein n=1 Tax=Glossina palpalis gambiensis TaxID=67801 RepID=A0A1B0BMD1_9MUSC
MEKYAAAIIYCLNSLLPLLLHGVCPIMQQLHYKIASFCNANDFVEVVCYCSLLLIFVSLEFHVVKMQFSVVDVQWHSHS